MAKVEVIKYICDVCRAEFDSEKEITKESIPCYGGERNEYFYTTSIDLCKKCSKKLRQVIYDNFASITDYYGVQIKKRDWSDSSEN